ncbi:hypothetical protein BDW75DRAFT_220392 [Aspergillus navahoensis]
MHGMANESLKGISFGEMLSAITQVTEYHYSSTTTMAVNPHTYQPLITCPGDAHAAQKRHQFYICPFSSSGSPRSFPKPSSSPSASST